MSITGKKQKNDLDEDIARMKTNAMAAAITRFVERNEVAEVNDRLLELLQFCCTNDEFLACSKFDRGEIVFTVRELVTLNQAVRLL